MAQVLVNELERRTAAMAHLCETCGCSERRVGCCGWRYESAAYDYAHTMGEDYTAVVQRLAVAIAVNTDDHARNGCDQGDDYYKHLCMREEQLVAGTEVAAERSEKQEKMARAFARLKELERFDTSGMDDEGAMARCRKCKSKEIEMISRQKASADEPATITCICSSCGERWKLAR